MRRTTALCSSLGLLLLSAACADDPTSPASTPPRPGPDPVPLGVVEVTISGIGTGQVSASASPVRPGDGPRLSMTVPNTTGGTANGSIQLQSVSNGSFTVGSRAAGGYRYIYSTFRVRNAQSNGAAYDTPRQNLTFVAASSATSLGGTAISVLRRFDNTDASSSIAVGMAPTGGALLDRTTGTVASELADVLQVFTEAELAAITPPAGLTLLPYGYVVRNPSNPGSRTLPASPAANQWDGLVTFALKVPLQSTPAEDPFLVALRFLVVDDSETRVTQSPEEQGSAGTAAVAARAQALGASLVTLLPGGAYTGAHPTRAVCTVRTAGTAAAPTASMAWNLPSLLSLSPDPYGAGPVFLGRSASLAATFDRAVPTPTAATFVVGSGMRGRRFVGGGYTGGGTATVATPTANYFAGEEVEVTFPGACTGRTARLRVATAAGAGTLGASLPFTTSTLPHSVALGDVNADGRLDMVLVHNSVNLVSVRLGAGDGTFGTAATHAVGAGPTSVALGDLDGDGDLDVVAANGAGNSVSVLLGNGAGGFGAAAHHAVGTDPRFVVLGDVNSDGRLDVATANAGSTNVSVLLGAPGGGLGAAQAVSTPAAPLSVALADVNGDGTLDLATANGVGGSASVRPGNGDGTFGAAATYAMGAYTYSVALGDVNGDGRTDLAVTNANGQEWALRMGNGNGTFGTLTTYSTAGMSPQSMALADVNGDGRLDLVAANSGSNNVSIRPGNGNGTFGNVATYPVVGNFPWTLAMGDLNGDGRLDAATANYASHSASVLLGQP